MSAAGYIIAATSPSSGAAMVLNARGNLEAGGKAKVFATKARAHTASVYLRGRHPQLAAFRIRVESISKRKNPSGFARATRNYAESIDEAANRFADFTGYKATKEIRFQQKPIHAGFALGKLVAVTYEQDREGDGLSHYHHEFKKKSRPLLVASSDGSLLGIVGGQYRVTNRGIEDE